MYLFGCVCKKNEGKAVTEWIKACDFNFIDSDCLHIPKKELLFKWILYRTRSQAMFILGDELEIFKYDHEPRTKCTINKRFFIKNKCDVAKATYTGMSCATCVR